MITVRLASTVNVALSGLAAVGGATPVADDPILLAGQTAGAENGLWLAKSGAWVRMPAYYPEGETVRVRAGTHAGKTFVQTTAGTVIVGVTALAYEEIESFSVADQDALDELVAAAPTDDLPTNIMFNGQSNTASAPANALGWSEITTLLGPDLLGYGHTAQDWVPVVDGTANARANHGGSGTGPGPGLGQIGTRLCRYIADATGSTVRTYSLAYSGQGISYFRKTSLTMAKFEDNSSHATLNNYNLLKSYVDATGIVPELYVWIQGEADAGSTPDIYYAQLAGHWADLQADYPNIKMLIVGTIQGSYDAAAATARADDRGSVAGGTVAGVRIAQKRLAAENPDRIYYVDTKDMRGFTAWFQNNHYSAHGGTYAASEEVALRCFAKLRGDVDRPAVVAAQHPQSVYAWDHAWSQRRSINGNGTLALWSDDIGIDSIGVDNGTPEHIPSDPNFGGRSVIRFDQASSERMTESSIAGGNRWVAFCVARLAKAALGSTAPCLWSVEPSALGNRIGFHWSSAGAPALFLEVAGSIPFTGAPIDEGDVAHTYCVVYDGDALTAKYYIDGILSSTRTAANGVVNVDTGATARIRVGSLSTGLHFGGEIAFLAVKAEPWAMPTDAEVMAMHVGARVEFKLET